MSDAIATEAGKEPSSEPAEEEHEAADLPRRPLRIDQWPRQDRPREKLLDRGAHSLTDSELLAVLIGSGGFGHGSALDLGRTVIARFGTVRGLARAAAGELAQVAGMGEARAARVLAALELARRLGLEPRVVRGRYRSAHEVYLAYRERLFLEKRELFMAVMLDGKSRPFREVVVSQGSLTASIVHPREVFEPLIRESAAAVLLVHNHPSGDPTPSPEDEEITRRLRQVGELVGIRVIDHVIVAEEGYSSFAERGWPT